jgi:hypothetical protein
MVYEFGEEGSSAMWMNALRLKPFEQDGSAMLASSAIIAWGFEKVAKDRSH